MKCKKLHFAPFHSNLCSSIPPIILLVVGRVARYVGTMLHEIF